MIETIDRRTRPLRGIFALIGLLILPAYGAAQPEGTAESLSEEAEASVLTIWPGEALYSAFGHTAIRIQDPATGLDRAYNYGTFDFETEGFYLKFLRGRLDYMLARAPTDAHLRLYRSEGRSVVEQQLGLSPAEVDSLHRFLEWNYRPEHRTYRYDFFFDNCATRPRDALERVLGDRLRFPRTQTPAESLRTFRRHLDPYLRDRPLIGLGVDLILGSPADSIAVPYETMFLPIELKEQLSRAELRPRPTGTPAEAAPVEVARPLITETDTLYWSGRPFPPEPALPWLPAALWILLAGALVQTSREVLRANEGGPFLAARRLDALLFGAVGVMGTIMLLLWTATDHAVTGPNWNLLWAWPTHILAAVAIWRGVRGSIPAAYLGASVGAVLVTLAGWPWLLQTLPATIVPLLVVLLLRGGIRGVRALP